MKSNCEKVDSFSLEKLAHELAHPHFRVLWAREG